MRSSTWFLLISVLLTGIVIAVLCSCAEKRTRYSDPVMRVMINFDKMDNRSFSKLAAAVVESGKWEVVDRGRAYKALHGEQDLIHLKEKERFNNADKYAEWGKLYGVGGIIQPAESCYIEHSWFSSHNRCLRFLELVSASTGEVIVIVKDEFNAGLQDIPDWDGLVDRMNSAFPSRFDSPDYSDSLKAYRARIAKDAEDRQLSNDLDRVLSIKEQAE